MAKKKTTTKTVLGGKIDLKANNASSAVKNRDGTITYQVKDTNTGVGSVVGKNALGGIDKMSSAEMKGTRAQGSTGVQGTETYKTLPKKEVGMISSQTGKNIVQGADQKIADLSPITADVSTPPSQQGTATQTPTAPEPTKETPTDTVTYVNEQTGQEQTFRGNAITDENKKNLESQGYKIASSDISTVPESPEITQAQKEYDTATSTVDSYISRLESMLISDKELRGEIRQISRNYDARKEEMRGINERRKIAMNTLGTRLGARYTGGTGGIFGSILSEEERQGLDRIEKYENDKQDAILAAKKAAREQNFQTYAQLAQRAEKIQEKKATELQALKKAQAEQNAKIAEEAKQAEYDALIIEQLGTGETDPIKIVQALAGRVPFDQIKAITELLPKKPEDFTLSEGQARYDASGKLIAARAKTYEPKAGGVGGGIPINPVGQPIVSGIGSTYETSSFEAQMLMDDIMNKIPVQLKNSEKEVAMKYEQIRKQLAAGYTYQQIVDRLSGFSLQNTADKDLGASLYDLALGTDIAIGDLSSLLNRGANEQAMVTVENAKLKDADGFFAQTDKARSTVEQADKVLGLMNSVPSDKLGAFDGRVFKVEKQLTPAESTAVQNLETALAIFNAPLRVAVAGTASTAQEAEKIAGFQASITDQPEIIKSKVTEMRDSIVQFHNEARSQRGLPIVQADELTDNQKRIKLYKKVSKEEDVKNMTNKDLFNTGSWSSSTPMSMDVFSVIGLE